MHWDMTCATYSHVNRVTCRIPGLRNPVLHIHVPSQTHALQLMACNPKRRVTIWKMCQNTVLDLTRTQCAETMAIVHNLKGSSSKSVHCFKHSQNLRSKEARVIISLGIASVYFGISKLPTGTVGCSLFRRARLLVQFMLRWCSMLIACAKLTWHFALVRCSQVPSKQDCGMHISASTGASQWTTKHAGLRFAGGCSHCRTERAVSTRLLRSRPSALCWGGT